MTTPNQQVRRATIDDLPKLIALWQQEGLPWEALEKRFKEFQVVEVDGELAGGLGLEVVGRDGRLHSEAFAYPELADAVRELLWERAQTLAKNHGLVRLWGQFTAPYWNRCGFDYAPTEILAKLPASFTGDPQPWRHLQLRDEASASVSFEKEFAMFKEMEKARTARIYQQAKVLRILAAVIILAVCGLLVFWVLAWMKARHQISR
jgi:N-acetylglutamate synthase-like GNAT family acetyltransferase